MVFAIHQHESDIGVHVPILNPILNPSEGREGAGRDSPICRWASSSGLDRKWTCQRRSLSVCRARANGTVRDWLASAYPPQDGMKCCTGRCRPLGESEVAQSGPTLCVLMDHSLPGSSIPGIFQARILEWGAISFCRGSSQPRD